MPVDTKRFRELFAAVPAPVAIVTSLDRDARPCGLTISTVTALTKAPPLLLVCLDTGSQTLQAIRDTKAFAVNFVDGAGHEVADRFSGKGKDKFRGVPFRPARHARGAPVLAGCVLAHAECVTDREIVVADHAIVIGRIEDCALHDRDSLIYHRRSYSAWPATAVQAL